MNIKNTQQNINEKTQNTLKDKLTAQQKNTQDKEDINDKKQNAKNTSDAKVNEDKPENQVKTLTEEVAHWKDLAMRATAEMENLRKRMQLDMEKTARYANGAFAKDLLPVADCLEQATSCAQNEIARDKENGVVVSAAVENLLKGVEMTYQNLMNALRKQQIEKIDSLGKVFDPNLHKVIQEVEDPDKEEGTIIQELQPGYTIGGDRVLRDAMVIVSKK